MAAPPPDDNVSPQWALGFESPIDSPEEAEEEEGKEKAEPEPETPGDKKMHQSQAKADTIRGTPTVEQPGPNLAERTEQETTKEFFDEMQKAEEAMRRDLETKKFSEEHINAIRELMAKSKGMPVLKKEEELSQERLKEKVDELQRKLDERGEQDDQTTAQMILLQDQVQQAEKARAAERDAKEALEADFRKEYEQAMAKIDAATEEQRAKQERTAQEKEKEIRKAEARKTGEILREKDEQIRSLQQELIAKQFELYRADAEKKEREESVKVEIENLKAELEEMEEENADLLREIEDVGKDIDKAEKYEVMVAELQTKVNVYETEDQQFLDQISSLSKERKQLALHMVRQKREMKAKNETISKTTEMLIEANKRITELSAIPGVNAEDIARANHQLYAENAELRELLEKSEMEGAQEEVEGLQWELEETQNLASHSIQQASNLDRQLDHLRQFKAVEEEKLTRNMRRLEKQLKEALSQVRHLEEMDKVELDPDQSELADLRARVQTYDAEKQEYQATIQENEDAINDITVQYDELLLTHEALEKELADSVDSVEKLEKDLNDATAGKQELAARIAALEEENEKLLKKAYGSENDQDEKALELKKAIAQSNLQVIEILMGAMVFQRALHGKTAGDMDEVTAAMNIATNESDKTFDERFKAEVAYWAALVEYYKAKIPSAALPSFRTALGFEVWEDDEVDMLKLWVLECRPETGSDCPRGASGYREALGLEPGPGTLKAPKKAAKKSEKVKNPRRAPAPRSRGVYRRDLYVDILSPRQEEIWDTIDLNNFDYDHLTFEQQSLFSFKPFEDEPDSPDRGAPPPPPDHPPYESPQAPQRHGRSGTPSSIASSAASITAEEDEGRKPSRMAEFTTDAALHIQWLTSRLADREALIRELENTHGDILTMRAQLHRQKEQILKLRNNADEAAAELTIWRRIARGERRKQWNLWAWIPV